MVIYNNQLATFLKLYHLTLKSRYKPIHQRPHADRSQAVGTDGSRLMPQTPSPDNFPVEYLADAWQLAGRSSAHWTDAHPWHPGENRRVEAVMLNSLTQGPKPSPLLQVTARDDQVLQVPASGPNSSGCCTRACLRDCQLRQSFSLFYFLVGLGLELRAFTLEPLCQPFLWWVFSR
jgi:hypothetical protein